ncbi:hypothetical protein JCM21738_5257 [Mesobacillus boroniphilus JCM 21738]|uniref:Uncharacterized protein n=1 Tax=Mesobacillus boroniphilus JCM 21738 TaxID=1294265 RepID=W4RWB9_9BACI|nr:hypothetical protein JCM21738_5257 [Mesobacillus boroniphilus JCM 21738]
MIKDKIPTSIASNIQPSPAIPSSFFFRNLLCLFHIILLNHCRDINSFPKIVSFNRIIVMLIYITTCLYSSHDKSNQ